MKYSWLRCALAALILLGSITIVHADSCIVSLCTKAPVIDGTIDPAEWAHAAAFDGTIPLNGALLERRRVRMWVGADATTLYLAMASQLPDEGILTTKVTTDSLKAVADDSIDLYVCPTPTLTDRVDYQYLCNSIGKHGYNIHKLGAPDEIEAWEGNWTAAHRVADGWWTMEIAIPIASMRMVAKGRKMTEGEWAINLCRNWKPKWEWSSLTGGYANKGMLFRFTEQPAPGVAYRCVNDPTFPPCEHQLTVTNPTAKPLQVIATMQLVRNNMPELKVSQPLTLAPLAAQTLKLPIDGNDPTTRYELAVQVTSPDAKTTYYERHTAWVRAQEPSHWVNGIKKDAPPLDFKFAYYPTRNLLRVVADLNGLPKDAAPTKVSAIVREHWTQSQVKVIEFPLAGFKNGVQEQQASLPELEGDYDIVLQASGPGVPATPAVKQFERTRFPWEGRPAGRSTTVYPPFTPIKVEGKSLSTVLRTHQLNDFGLLDQITATSANTGVAKPILAAPMRYVATVGGAATPLTAAPMRTSTAAPHTAVVDGAFSGGALQATYKNTWDYDGTLRVDLTLLPSGGKAIDALTLEIPFSNESAPLIHANADRIRVPIAQKVSAGKGVVWDARAVACDDYIKNFCPYIYLGSAVRGLCWFAENDRNWGWNPKTPNLEVVRDGGQVILRIHLINTPTTITAPQTLTFGLLAAPVKPMLNKAGEGPHWWRYRYLRDRYRLLGTDINWFGNHSCGTVYPMSGDLYLWEMLARGSRERLSDAVIEQFVKDSHAACQGEIPNNWDATVRANMRAHTGGKMIFYYNRAVCQELPEVETFKDEWLLDDLRALPKGKGRREIKVVPSDSYIDFCLYWYARSFEIGNNTGVYWDNFFFVPTSNTEMSEAYTRLDGTIVPATGVWKMRELVKRTFVMMNERGMLPITFPHMTSFSPLPILSFATVQYDWEWKYSEGDVQDRFSREYLQLVSTGELAGVWPVPLDDHGGKMTDPWTQRTFTAARLVHELDGIGGFNYGRMKCFADLMSSLGKPVLEMLERPGVQVYKYWEDRPLPVKAEQADLPTLVYSVPGKEALAVVTSYLRQDVAATLTVDLQALGMTRVTAVTDAETGAVLPYDAGRITLPVKKHDVRMIRIVGE